MFGSRIDNRALVRVRRHGLSLVEVLVAVVILGAGLTAATGLLARGAALAARIETDSEAASRCQSRMELLLSGGARMRSSGWTIFADDENWEWAASLSPSTTSGLSLLTVAVRRVESDSPDGICRLRRLVRDSVFTGKTSGGGR
jgi:prepilin-type N-terminal cleavage/methylation domain-containing protein